MPEKYNPLLHSHEWGDWSPWTHVPGTNMKFRMHGCLDINCLMIVTESEWIDPDKVDYSILGDYEHNDCDARCNDLLIEKEWEDGFRCFLPDGHRGAHRVASYFNENLIGVHKDGRPYEYAYEWRYTDA